MDKELHKRLLNICFKNKLHHLGSYFSSVDIIDNIYKNMSEDDIFILSNGHASVAQYVVLEKYYGIDAEKLLKDLGEHPKRDEERKIFSSSGSLGMGITVAVGRALANKSINVHCLISDGECAEGSVWESLKFIYENNIQNIHIYVNANGWAAYDKVDLNYLERRLTSFYPDIKFIRTSVDLYGLKGQDAHYKPFTEDQFVKAIDSL
ncbi:MAG: 1-deoxy-D-xylulose-5-phosphate synthase N-terminal domain-containing protein [Alphaproteobacteria bacterium]